MVAKERDPNTAGSRFVLRPNRSLSWRATKWFFAGSCLLYACIGTFFLALGAWPILPFAGLEVIVLGAGLYVSALRGKACEVINVTGDTIEVQAGTTGKMRSYRLPRFWTRVTLRGDDWYPSRLTLSVHGRGLELGRFLNEEERLELAQELTRALGPTQWVR